MLRALVWMAALAALVAAALYLPLQGKPLWARVHGDRAVAWARQKLAPEAPPGKKPAKAAARARPPPAKKQPAERITQDDRAALDALVAGAR